MKVKSYFFLNISIGFVLKEINSQMYNNNPEELIQRSPTYSFSIKGCQVTLCLEFCVPVHEAELTSIPGAPSGDANKGAISLVGGPIWRKIILA